jgi:hypothetical protein
VGAAAPGLIWTFVAPLLFYLTWQLCYFLVVQVRACSAPLRAGARWLPCLVFRHRSSACKACSIWRVAQVLFRKYILAHGYQTSYIALARRAARTNNFWNRLVRKGSVMRRCATYGALRHTVWDALPDDMTNSCAGVHMCCVYLYLPVSRQHQRQWRRGAWRLTVRARLQALCRRRSP